MQFSLEACPVLQYVSYDVQYAIQDCYCSNHFMSRGFSLLTTSVECTEYVQRRWVLTMRPSTYSPHGSSCKASTPLYCVHFSSISFKCARAPSGFVPSYRTIRQEYPLCINWVIRTLVDKTDDLSTIQRRKKFFLSLLTGHHYMILWLRWCLLIEIPV